MVHMIMENGMIQLHLVHKVVDQHHLLKHLHHMAGEQILLLHIAGIQLLVILVLEHTREMQM